MISTQILQHTLDSLKNITRIELSVMDTDGRVIAATQQEIIGTQNLLVPEFVNSQAESQTMQGKQYFKVFDEYSVELVIGAEGEAEDVYKIGKIAALQIQSLFVAYKERYDKDNFVKNLLLDNLLLVDIYNRAKKLHVESHVNRVVYIIESAGYRDSNIIDIIRGIFPEKNKDFLTAVDERNIILVKNFRDDATPEDVQKVAKAILDTLSTEAMKKIYIAYGNIVKDIKDVSKSFKEAKMALEVGKIFNEDKYIVGYNNLGIGRLIYQLPIPLCKMFIKEIFDDKSPDDFDVETIQTINKFFETSLNVSETSRQLYIHRNTLVYRLDKLQKTVGLDLRIFEDAITFKIALMVVKYMKHISNREFN